MSYQVRLDVFEGPFDLLVYLIEHARMSLYDIQISEITTQYLDYLDAMQASDIAVTQEFMVLAAELIELKSRMLLPHAEDSETEEGEDPRRPLVEKLLEYKKFKELAAFLGEQQEIAEHIHTKPKEDLSRYEEAPDEILRATPEQFAQAFRAFLFKRHRLEEMRRVYERVERQWVSVEEKAEEIGKMFSGRRQLMFSEVLGQDQSVENRVLSFMALLEMLREKKVVARQKALFSDIRISLAKEAGAQPEAEERV